MALSLIRYTSSTPDSNNALHRLLTERMKKEREGSMLISIEIKNGVLLSEDLLIEILSWLPVKEVLKYKSCILALFSVTPAGLNLCELLFDETPRVLASQVLDKAPAYKNLLWGSCDGLYYVCEGGRALWNPTINELRTLPPIITKPNPPPNAVYSCHDLYGFGSDPVTGDYKVVVIKEYWPANKDEQVSYPASVLAFSLRTDSGKYCGDLTRVYYLYQDICYIFVGGCCFWRATSTQDDEHYSEVIVSFDMASDSFQEIPAPENQQSASKCLGVYDDSLVFFSALDNILSIWTLSHGIWTKKIVMGLGSLNGVFPIGHWMNNKVLLECKGLKLFLCDPNTQEMKDLGFEGWSRFEGFFTYMESLVSVKDRDDEQVEV